ncbi:hypothetical protein [Aquisphaera insulae]|uniref:hypothetical protein n=1 Tax=Aquisphaera insulae TaxID=2712864 RepID=UPI0013EAF146|nr:hypothetical protein [Aquisphaera insulae]
MCGIRSFESSRSLIARSGVGCLTLAALLALGGVPSARGQGFGADPFRPYNSQYDAYVYPVAPSMSYGYNNAPPRVGGTTPYQNYLDSLSGPSGGGGRSGVGVHYNQANRAYDRELRRIYEPNKESDAEFQARQEAANDIYFKYFREKNQKKRAELLRQYNRARTREDLELDSRGGVARAPKVPATREGAGLGRERSRTARYNSDGPPPLSGSRSAPRRRSPAAGSGAAAKAGSDPATSPTPPATIAPGSRPAATPATTAPAARPAHEETPSEVLDRARRSEPASTATPAGVAPRRSTDGPPPLD